MNNIYLKKLIEQETSNVKLQLVQEHLQLAKKEFSQKQKDLNSYYSDLDFLNAEHVGQNK